MKSPVSNIQLLSFKHILNLLHKKPLNLYELEELTGLANNTVNRWIRLLHSNYPHNLIYIHHYDRTGSRGNWTRYWAVGIGFQDAPKPKPLTNSEYNKRWRHRKARESRISSPQQGVICHAAD